MYLIEGHGIAKRYGKKEVLRDISFQAEAGECIGILGQNGCGKTTLLSVLAGAVRADRGSLRIQGREMLGRTRLLSQMAAYVPQENPLIEELTARDNLLLWHGGNRKQMEYDLEEGAASLLGIPQMLSVTVKKMSGGMKKRLSIACALTASATVLILDEPGAALDLECKELIRSYIRSYLAGGGAVLLTSHEMSEIELCSRCLILKDGRLESVKQGLSEQELIRRFTA